jgi:hypothetical protein
MHLLQALLNLRLSPDQPLGDAVCSVAVVPRKPPHQPAEDRKEGGAGKASSASTGSATFSFKPFKLSGLSSSGASESTLGPLDVVLPPLAISRIWEQLSDADKRNVRCVQRSVCLAFSRAVSGLQVGTQ